MSRRATFWANRRLETRIATAIVLAIGSILALAMIQLAVVRRPEFVVFQRDWLTRTVAEALDRAVAVPPQERPAALSRLPATRWLTISWMAAEPHADPRPPPRPPLPQLDRSLEAGLVQALADRAKAVGVRYWRPHGGPPGGARPPPPPRGEIDRAGALPPLKPPGASESEPRHHPDFRVTVIPPDDRADAKSDRQDLVPAVFDIKVELQDGSWIRIVPNHADRRLLGGIPLLLFGGALVVVALSMLTARRILAPLNELTGAAKRLGLERTAAPVPTAGLYEFAPIASALNEMHGRLSKFVDERTQMLAAISHDMRTSLTRLSLSIEDVADARLKSALTQEVAEMNGMLSATLAFARSDHQAEAGGDVDLAALLISLCDEASDKGHLIEFAGPDHLTLYCQRLLLKRALTNIVDNAVKYGSSARVCLSRANGEVVVEVTDDGPGIPPQERERAFEPFVRLERSRNRATGGVGLGLAIARDAVHAHGGRIELGAAPGGGLLVRVVLH